MLYTFSQAEMDLMAGQLLCRDWRLIKDFGACLPTFLSLSPIHYN